MGLRIRGLAGGLLAAGLLLGCGATPAPPPGSPPGSPQCPTADLPEDIEGGAPALPEGVFVLQGPADAKGRWEPSAVEVVDGALWVAGDKQPTLARFCLPGAPTVPPTVHDYVSAHHVPTRLDKIEALAPTGDGGLWVFELKGGERLRCAAPGRCASTPVSTAARQVATEAIEAQGGTVHRGDDGPWTGIEGYAHQGDHAWYGVRQYYQSPDAAVPWSALVHEGPGASLRVLHPGHVLRDGDRAYGISGLAADGEHLWVL
ncbi:MAG: hypothetical protein KC613_05255, partial [Myxococcales bacterium]|nr:hypothetical protein [Myxococcales bacterium]